jgi:hypothetical protein
MRYCIPGRTFLDVPDRSALQPFTVPDRLHARSMGLRPFYDQKSSETVIKRSEKVKDVQGRSETVNGLKRLQNHVMSDSSYSRN